MKSELVQRVGRTIEKYNMAHKGERLLVGLSGGADSAALLLCLHELGYDICACHVNHCIRGEEADRDQHFCEELCRGLGIDITVKRVDVPAYCRENPVSEEEGARLLRYKALQEIEADKICTAHNLDDCLETTLFNLARGSGLKGIASIPPVRENIIRPLIECSRAEIEDFLRSHGQDWVTDSTNLTDEHTRNRIRHGIVPRLRDINPSLETTMRGTLENLRQDNRLIAELADEFYRKALTNGGLDVKMLLEGAPSLTGRAIRRFIGENGCECPRETVLRIMQFVGKGGKLNIGEGKYAVSDGKTLRVTGEKLGYPYTEIAVKAGESAEFHGRKVTISLITNDISVKSSNIHQNLTYQAADYGKIKGVIVVRNRRAGDRIRLKGRGFTSDVKKLLQAAVPSGERGRAVVLADDEGVIFVEGCGFAERVAAESGSKTLLFCKIS